MTKKEAGIPFVFRFEALDGLRGLACLMVLIAHFCSATGLLTHFPGIFNAVLAVDTFFVLSGFVLAHSFLSREQRTLPIAPVGLSVQRWVRLWVPFAVATLIGVGLRFGLEPHLCSNDGALLVEYCQRWNTQETMVSLAKQLLLFYSPNINAPSWTLPIELLNSLLVPALMLLLIRSPIYLALLTLLSVFSIFLPITMPPCLYLFSAGCALRQGLLPQNSGRYALPLVVITYLLFLPNLGVKQDVQQVLIAPAAVALVLLAMRHHRISAFFLHPSAQLMGRLSFPLYLLHWPLLLGVYPHIYAMFAYYNISSTISFALSAIIYLVVTIASSIIFEFFIDHPSTLLGRYLRRAITM